MADHNRSRDAMGETMAIDRYAPPDAYTVPVPWPVAPGMRPVRVVPPEERDAIERGAAWNGYDRNAVMPDDVMNNYFFPPEVEEKI